VAGGKPKGKSKGKPGGKPKGKPDKAVRRRGPLARASRRGARWVGVALLILFGVTAFWAASYRVINPPLTYLIVAEWWRLGEVERDWRDIEEAPTMALAVMAAEDARFCAHLGFDFEAIRKALEESQNGGRMRGASTISQQVAKNAFLWPGRNWARKGLEVVFTAYIEAFWPKWRILEVYLNIAEMGEGVFGAEAAAQRYFGIGADKLSVRQAALIAAALPNPKERNPGRPSGYLSNRAAQIAHGVETLRVEGAECLGLK
jgi:monofunctional biosynthetic peptidoglycan transglycosylase